MVKRGVGLAPLLDLEENLSSVLDNVDHETLLRGFVRASPRGLLGRLVHDIPEEVVDIVTGFVAFLPKENLSPEEINKTSQPFYDLVEREVMDKGGVVDSIFGNRVFVHFGADRAIEDSALRALTAFMNIRSKVNNDGLDVAFSLASGKAFYGFVGNEQRADLTAIGEPVEVAFNLLKSAHSGQILVDKGIEELTRERMGFHKFGELSDGLEIYEPVSPVTHLGDKPVDSIFVGRSRELQELEQRVRYIYDGQPYVVVLLGGAGIGKSTLLKRLMTNVNYPDYIFGQATSITSNEPFYFVRNLLNERFLSVENLRNEVINELGMEEFDFNMMEILYGVKSGYGDFSPSLLTNELHKTFLKYFTKLGEHKRNHPPILIVEDGHYLDDSSLSLINYLAKNMDFGGIIWTNRVTEFKLAHEEIGKRYYPIPVDPLSESDSAMILRNYGVDDNDLIKQAEGIPLNLELLAVAHKEGIFGGSDIERRIMADVNKTDEEKVQDIIYERIMVRIHNRGDAMKKIMMAAAVLDTYFTKELIDEMLGGDIWLDPMVQGGLLELEDNKYIVAHDTVSMAVLSRMLEDKRKEYHLKAAVAYEKIYPGEDIVERLIYHLSNGGVVHEEKITSDDIAKKLVNYLRKGAEKAEALGAIDKAEKKMIAAIELLDENKSLDFANLNLDVRMDLCNFYERMLDVRLRPEREKAYEISLNNPVCMRGVYRALFGIVLNRFEEGRFSEALESLRDVSSLVGVAVKRVRNKTLGIMGRVVDDEDLKKLFDLDKYRANISMTSGRINYVLGLLAKADEINLSNVHFENATRFFKESIDILERRTKLSNGEVLTDLYLEAVLNLNYALSMTECGDIVGADERLENARRICKQKNYKVLLGYYGNAMAINLTYKGKYDEAKTTLDEALGVANSAGNNSLRMFIDNTYGDLATITGETNLALDYYLDGLSLIRERGEKFFEYRLVESGVEPTDEQNLSVGDIFNYRKIFETKIKRLSSSK